MGEKRRIWEAHLERKEMGLFLQVSCCCCLGLAFGEVRQVGRHAQEARARELLLTHLRGWEPGGVAPAATQDSSPFGDVMRKTQEPGTPDS